MSSRDRWLREITNTYYSQASLVNAHTTAVLNDYRTLSPKTDMYVSDSGHSALLLCISGTIPVSYRQSTYHIPLEIWLPLAYPQEPPIIYLKPTGTMVIRKGGDVDSNGRVDGEYIRAWGKKFEAKDLCGMVRWMQETFGLNPPLWNNSTKNTQPNPELTVQVQNHVSPPPRPPKPQTSISQWQQNMYTRPPPPLPSTSASPVTTPAKTPPIPPLSSRPLSGIYTPPMDTLLQHPQSPLRQPSYLPPATHNVANIQSQSWEASPPIESVHFVPTSLPRQPPFHEPTAYYGPLSNALPQIMPQVTSSPAQHPNRSHRHTPSLLDTEDLPSFSAPPPKRPPNPYLLSLRNDFFMRLKNALQAHENLACETEERQKMMQKDLLKGPPAIEDEMARLMAVKDVCMTVKDRYAIVVTEGDERVRELKRRGEGEVDELVCGTRVVHNQLIDCIAEDLAIEDTVYQLERKVDKEGDELEKVLKRVGQLGNEQFTKRVISNKILLELAVRRAEG